MSPVRPRDIEIAKRPDKLGRGERSRSSQHSEHSLYRFLHALRCDLPAGLGDFAPSGDCAPSQEGKNRAMPEVRASRVDGAQIVTLEGVEAEDSPAKAHA